ncbi:MAG TPA: polysaccharide deacetylase family protein [Rhizomicrobium sp.]|jgi:cellulose synthase/poly-beta-1,6-N-acetylglucosamine synthase-like glycosyltransferase/peptidoglycan/xylan/chitin deacetylase (PgdA/CDA1 family)/spore germination protein YaaH
MANKQIFSDLTGRRAARVSLIAWALATVSGLMGAGFLVSMIMSPVAQPLRFPDQITAVQLEKKAVAPGLLHLAENLGASARLKQVQRQNARWKKVERSRRNPVPPGILAPQPGRSLSIAFYPDWDPLAIDSLKAALPSLDWVMPTWLSMTGPDMTLKDAYSQTVYGYIRRNKPSVAIVPTVQNASGGVFNGPGLAKLLADKTRRAALIAQLVQYTASHKLQGVTIDFEEIHGAAGYRDLGTFLKELTAAFRPHGWIVVQAAQFDDDDWPFASYAAIVDYTLLMAYDEHFLTSQPGSIASQSWYEDLLDQRMRVLPPSRTLISIGSYGYDWDAADTKAEPVGYADAITLAHDADATIDFDDATNNPHFSYAEDDGTKHQVWLLDGVTAYNEIHAADLYRPAGYAVWKLGSEDPSIWTVMGQPYDALPPDSLRAISTVEDINFNGSGEILRVDAMPEQGQRSFEVDKQTGDIDDETYQKLPSGYVIHQFGASGKEVALTFDDGPDPEWTPQVLDVLKEKHVTATFFDIGSNVEANPGLVQRELDDGNEIGSHTFTHPNLADIPQEAVNLELNATQRLFEALTGRSLRLFRPPYLGDAEPTDGDEILPVKTAQDLGYITVGEHVDPVDWALPGVDKIVQAVMKQVHDVRPDVPRNIILLHDAGGDRSQTVAALPIIIDRLRAEGYKFVLVSKLAGLSRDQAMPPLPSTVALLTDRVVFLTISTVGHVLYYCFLAAIWLGVSRLFFLAGLSLWGRRKEATEFQPPPKEEPFRVTVIIPAYNEEQVIATTVRGIMASTYKNLEILVIDDGSKDKTLDVLHENFDGESSVTIVGIPNGGKANALNYGLTLAQGSVIVALDADTQFERDTIARLVRWFTEEDIGAVAGNAKVGNRINMITRWQALEYIVAQNLERRALAALGTLTVVPGAVGAWRKSVLVELGGFPPDTMAEDQDLTIAIQREGYGVGFDSSAIAWTEAPQKVRGLAKQRFRWAYGTLQCLWKYRGMMFRPRYGALGLIALPQVWVFQILLTALAPVADLLLIWQLAWQGINYLEHGAEFSGGDLYTVGLYYVVFTVVDILAAVFGFLMERRENWNLLWWLPLQRFGYRQIMYYVVVRSIWTAIRGAVVGWGKLERTATVKVKHAEQQGQ